MTPRKPIPRIASAIARQGCLEVVFEDGQAASVPLERIAPNTGRADWSQLTIEFKGAHVKAPVEQGDFDEHEVPSDVLKRIAEETVAASAAKQRSA